MSSTNHFAPAHSSQLAAESPSAFQYGSVQPQATDSIGLEEEMPPAYTPSADTYHGETTVETGPRRPFQQQPRPSHSTHRPSYSYSSSHSHSSHTTSSSSNSQPLSLSQQHPQPLRTVPSSWSTYTTGQQYQPRRGGGLVGTLVGTVRDAIDAVSSLHDEQMRTMQQSQARAYASPRPTSSSSRITQNTSTPSYQGGQAPVSGVPSAQQIPDDGSPTRTPAPGHPLLNNGHLLVYPNKDYTCIKLGTVDNTQLWNFIDNDGQLISSALQHVNAVNYVSFSADLGRSRCRTNVFPFADLDDTYLRVIQLTVQYVRWQASSMSSRGVYPISSLISRW